MKSVVIYASHAGNTRRVEGAVDAAEGVRIVLRGEEPVLDGRRQGGEVALDLPALAPQVAEFAAAPEAQAPPAPLDDRHLPALAPDALLVAQQRCAVDSGRTYPPIDDLWHSTVANRPPILSMSTHE